jgi:hypothetical protein
MSDVEAAAFSKPGQKITIQYGATPATVEKVGNTPAKPKQTWARSAAYVIGFIVIVVGATLMYRHWMTDDDSAVAAVDETIVHTPSSSTPARYHHNGLTPPAPPATGNIMDDIANGVTNGILANPKDGEEIRPDIKVDTGFVNEHGETVYADSEGHVQDHYMVAPER